MDNVYEIRIVEVSRMPARAKADIMRQVSEREEGFKFQGFAKVTYVTASPTRVASIEPIEGTIVDYFKKSRETSGADCSVF
jgi:hypothetical protein